MRKDSRKASYKNFKYMKKNLFFVLLFVCGICVANDEVQPYMTVEQLPNLIKCLPAPPAFDSPEFANDLVRYAWGRQQRMDEKRAEIARRDAVWNYDSLFAEFNIPFGLVISKEGTPEIYKLLITSLTTTDAMRVAPKAFYHRLRPFEYLGDHMLIESEEQDLRGEGSYPSGHTHRGYTCALLLAEINPVNADTILARGWMYGESRVIDGAHWQSDVDASRVSAAIGYGALHTCPAFLDQMALAQTEFLKMTGKCTKKSKKR